MDLILRAFFDVGFTHKVKRSAEEFDETLAGAGLGAELKILQNLTLRLDWAVPLVDTDDGLAQAGVHRVHFVATVLY